MTESKPDLGIGIEERYLKIQEAAAYCRTPLSSFRKWVQAGRVKYYKPGKQLLFLKTDLDRFIKSTAA